MKTRLKTKNREEKKVQYLQTDEEEEERGSR
jgi:hypothetical protein